MPFSLNARVDLDVLFEVQTDACFQSPLFVLVRLNLNESLTFNGKTTSDSSHRLHISVLLAMTPQLACTMKA